LHQIAAVYEWQKFGGKRATLGGVLIDDSVGILNGPTQSIRFQWLRRLMPPV
jgi:hypothetical protein